MASELNYTANHIVKEIQVAHEEIVAVLMKRIAELTEKNIALNNRVDELKPRWGSPRRHG